MALGQPDMKILIVDDFPTMRRIVKTLLRQVGYDNFVEAVDGEDGLEKLKANPDIEFVISDWNMPNMTGLEFLISVRGNEDLAHIPFLMITSETEREHIVEAVKAGVNNYVVKPFTGGTLKEKMDKVFANLAQKAS